MNPAQPAVPPTTNFVVVGEAGLAAGVMTSTTADPELTGTAQQQHGVCVEDRKGSQQQRRQATNIQKRLRVGDPETDTAARSTVVTGQAGEDGERTVCAADPATTIVV